MKSSFKLRPYQIEISTTASVVLQNLKIVYLCMEVRTGKTLTALQIAENYGAQSVLFLTKKRAIPSIESDYKALCPNFKLTVINNESLHKVNDNFDLLISDEHHRNGAYPKPNQITKLIKKNYNHLPMIFLSGTPHPESYSQIFHQFWLSKYSPFQHSTFYKWAKEYVNVKDRHLGYAVVKDYSDANRDEIMNIINPYLITFTQSEAGFTTEVKEHVLKVKMKDITYKATKYLQKNKYIKSKEGEVIADTAVKEMQKLHQMFSGTVLTEEGKPYIFDLSKAYFIKEHFKDKRLGIFYKFKAEYKALQIVLGSDLCDNLNDFNNGCKYIALQIVSGSEGISLRNADYLVYYNIDFSAKNYWQSRDRLTTMQRKSNDVYWIFAEGGIEEKIYKAVQSKKNYTTSIYKKDYDLSTTNNKRMGV